MNVIDEQDRFEKPARELCSDVGLDRDHEPREIAYRDAVNFVKKSLHEFQQRVLPSAWVAPRNSTDEQELRVRAQRICEHLGCGCGEEKIDRVIRTLVWVQTSAESLVAQFREDLKGYLVTGYSEHGSPQPYGLATSGHPSSDGARMRRMKSAVLAAISKEFAFGVVAQVPEQVKFGTSHNGHFVAQFRDMIVVERQSGNAAMSPSSS